MTYEELKSFCNSLTPEQLLQEVYLARVDDSAIKVESTHISEEDEYFDHTDSLGTLESIKEEYPESWMGVIGDATILPSGTVMLMDE